jgi:hypothetical protein
LSPKYSETKIHKFIKAFVESKQGQVIDQSADNFTIIYPNKTPKEYTYKPEIARDNKKIFLITPSSPALRDSLKECAGNGVLCQVLLKPKGTVQSLVKQTFKDGAVECKNCDKMTTGAFSSEVCVKSPPCNHKIHNAKIASVKVIKHEQVQFFRFYFSAIFQNKLRPKCEEKIAILVDKDGKVVPEVAFREEDPSVLVEDYEGDDLEPAVFDALKGAVYERLNGVLREKLAFFDLTLSKEIKSKLKSFDKRLKGERREQAISRKNDFDKLQWQANYEALLKREEESFITNIAVKFLNLLVINTTKISFTVNLDNKAKFNSAFILGMDIPTELVCPECGAPFFEGYATEDAKYLCRNCIQQSIDTGKIYSAKADLTFDATLYEYMEQDAGFVCAVCGERHSHLLEFKCTHDNSSVCIHHYGLCDLCGQVFSERNLAVSKQSQRKLCPAHAVKCGACGEVVGVDEGQLCKATGELFCSSCTSFTKCTSCQQEYSAKAVVAEKCPACSNLSTATDQTLIEAVQNYDENQRKTTKWLIGKNALNAVVVAKGVFSSTLYVVENGKVTYQKSMSFFNKLRGH